MSSNPRWCLSFTEWRSTFSAWISRGDPDALLNATIFFDFRPLYGNAALAESLRDWLTEAARDNPRLLRQMAENALRSRPPRGVLRDFTLSDDRDHPGTLDLKVNGGGLFIEAARIYALAAGVPHTNTARRLLDSAANRGVPATEAESWVGAFHFLQLLRLRHQQGQIAGNQPADNHLDPDRLNELARRILKKALRQAKSLQNRLKMDFQL